MARPCRFVTTILLSRSQWHFTSHQSHDEKEANLSLVSSSNAKWPQTFPSTENSGIHFRQNLFRWNSAGDKVTKVNLLYSFLISLSFEDTSLPRRNNFDGSRHLVLWGSSENVTPAKQTTDSLTMQYGYWHFSNKCIFLLLLECHLSLYLSILFFTSFFFPLFLFQC